MLIIADKEDCEHMEIFARDPFVARSGYSFISAGMITFGHFYSFLETLHILCLPCQQEFDVPDIHVVNNDFLSLGWRFVKPLFT